MASTLVRSSGIGPRTRRRISRAWLYLVAVAVLGLVVVPISFAVLGGFRTNLQLVNDPAGLPDPWVASNYTSILKTGSFWRQVWNSTLIAMLTMLFVLPAASMAAFVLARYSFKGRELIYGLFTLGLLFPVAVAILPLFIVLRQTNLLSTPLGVALPQAAFGLPLSIVIMRPFFRAIPRELQDAAAIDGCGPWRFYRLIMLPLSRPVLSTVAVIAIVGSWNAFLLPLLVLVDPDKHTLPIGVNNISSQYSTDFALVLYRTQLFNPGDIDNVKKIQAGYRVEPLSAFLRKPAPVAMPEINFVKPLGAEEERTSLQFFNLLNFILQFCPTHASEKPLMARLAKIGVGAGKSIDVGSLTPGMRQALEGGMADAWKAFNEYKAAELDTGRKTSGDSFGTRASLKNDYLSRMSGAVLGIYGNSKQEAMYPLYLVDSGNQKLNGTHRYTLRFAPGQLPPVNAFWSLTMYELPASLLYANPLKRYLINSPMLPNLKRDDDGGITLYVQNQSPGGDREANWLPAPKGPFFTALRLYWPKPDALGGKWTAPPLRKEN